MSCVSESRIAPVSGSARLSTSVPRSPRDAFLITSTGEGGSVFAGFDGRAVQYFSRHRADTVRRQ